MKKFWVRALVSYFLAASVVEIFNIGGIQFKSPSLVLWFFAFVVFILVSLYYVGLHYWTMFRAIQKNKEESENRTIDEDL